MDMTILMKNPGPAPGHDISTSAANQTMKLLDCPVVPAGMVGGPAEKVNLK